MRHPRRNGRRSEGKQRLGEERGPGRTEEGRDDGQSALRRIIDANGTRGS